MEPIRSVTRAEESWAMWLVVAPLQSNDFPQVRVHDACEICLTKISAEVNLFNTMFLARYPSGQDWPRNMPWEK